MEPLSKQAVLWQCRRGMLELDLLLTKYCDQGYEMLDSEGKNRFIQLLKYPDPILYEWLIAESAPQAVSPELQNVVDRIRGLFLIKHD